MAAVPRTSYRVVAVRYGTRETTKSETYYRYSAYGEPDVPLRMDYFFWILEGRDRTLVIDTGFEPDVGVRRGRTCLCPPAEALARLGVDPAQVSQVILTHLHYDHIGNVNLFPRSEIVLAQRELEFWTGPYATRFQIAEPVERSEIAGVEQADREGRVTLVADEQAVAPGVTAIRVGGHTPGQLVVVVATEGGQAVIASDALHYYEELERDRPFVIFTDLSDAYRAFDTLGDLTADPASALVAGHDPRVIERFPSLTGECADLAVRIA